MFSEKIKEAHKITDLTGNHYGELEVLGLSDRRIGKKILWICKCSCGRIVEVLSSNLKNGNTKTCGAMIHRKKHLEDMWNKTLTDLTGLTFGSWLVLRRDGSTQPTKWICKCLNCETVKSVLATNLKNGSSTSCGCSKHNKSLEGQTIGFWNVGTRSNRQRPNGHYCTTYLCTCKCGTKRYVDESRLINGTSLSCGCLKSKANEAINQILNERSIPHQGEYSYSDLIGPGGGLLRFDCAILDNEGNVKCLIEYQAEQHYSDTEFGRQQREITDPQKRKYCIEHKIPLYEIRFDENLDEKMEDIISNITC